MIKKIKKIFFSPLNKKVDKIFPFKYRLLCFFLPLFLGSGFVVSDVARFYDTTLLSLLKNRIVGMGRVARYAVTRNNVKELRTKLPQARKDLEKIVEIFRTGICEIGGEVRKNDKINFYIIPNILGNYAEQITKLYEGKYNLATIQKLFRGIEIVEHHLPSEKNYLNVTRKNLEWLRSKIIKGENVSKNTYKAIASSYVYNVTKSYYIRGFETKDTKDMEGKFIGYFHVQGNGISEDDIKASKFSPEFVIADSEEKIKVYYLHREKKEKIDPIYEFELKNGK